MKEALRLIAISQKRTDPLLRSTRIRLLQNPKAFYCHLDAPSVEPKNYSTFFSSLLCSIGHKYKFYHSSFVLLTISWLILQSMI